MTHRERALAALHYASYDRLPIIHFGFWGETLHKWRAEGHLADADLADGGARAAVALMGFDYEWNPHCYPAVGLRPWFESKVLETLPDGSRKVRNGDGVVVLAKDDAGSIPAEIDHLLKTRADWEEHYLPRLQWSDDRVPDVTPFLDADHDEMRGLHCGSLFGIIRNWVGVTGAAYIYADDEDLFDEMINVVGDLAYRGTEAVLVRGGQFDYAHFWEDICFKNGPLVVPGVFMEKVGPHYRRITELVNSYGLDIVSLDCDGMIDALIPTWFQNGVNTMFPIEVGTWEANIAPWRAQYGRGLRGVGGMNKVAFARDKAAIDDEIERLKPLIDLGGYLPCPDHRIAPDAKFELVCYYTERMRAIYG
jgi:uroporphyrinogen decarboxylase